MNQQPFEITLLHDVTIDGPDGQALPGQPMTCFRISTNVAGKEARCIVPLNQDMLKQRPIDALKTALPMVTMALENLEASA